MPRAKTPKPVETGVPATAATTAEFNWDELPATDDTLYTRGKMPEEVLATIPDTIRTKLSEALEAGLKDKRAGKVQKCLTTEKANAFLRLLRKAAANSQPRLTIKGGVDPKDPTVVRYAVRPFEARPRKAAAATTPAATSDDEKNGDDAA